MIIPLATTKISAYLSGATQCLGCPGKSIRLRLVSDAFILSTGVLVRSDIFQWHRCNRQCVL